MMSDVFFSGFIKIAFTIPTPDNPHGTRIEALYEPAALPLVGTVDVFRKAVGADVVDLWQHAPGHYFLTATLTLDYDGTTDHARIVGLTDVTL